MLDLDDFVFCEHDREPDACPICGSEKPERPVFDPHVLVEQHLAGSHHSSWAFGGSRQAGSASVPIPRRAIGGIKEP